MIKIENVSLSYGEKAVLKNCSVHLEAGSRTALMGPSGCGKTSLINIAAGLISPDEGSVSVGGKVSFVFQESALFPWLTAAENVNAVLSDGPSTMDAAKALLSEAELGEHADKLPRQLSGGQKQRVSICRALAFGGDVLLLDEPLKGLDPELRSRMAEMILRHSEGKTLLLVTHDPWEAEALCGTVLRYENGKFI